jgi:hypothetical protein
MTLASIVEILEEFISREITARFDDARQTRIIEVGFVADAAFPTKTQPDMAPADVRVPIAQCSRSSSIPPSDCRG